MFINKNRIGFNEKEKKDGGGGEREREAAQNMGQGGDGLRLDWRVVKSFNPFLVGFSMIKLVRTINRKHLFKIAFKNM